MNLDISFATSFTIPTVVVVFTTGLIYFFISYGIGYALRRSGVMAEKPNEVFINIFVLVLLSLSLFAVFACWWIGNDFTGMHLLETITQSIGIAFGIRDANNKMNVE